MRAAAIMKTGEIRMLEVDKPAVGPDEVLIRVAYCGICATDYDNYLGITSFARTGKLRYPLRFGHEWSGVVAEAGPAVDIVKVGDKVIGDGKITCGKCVHCLAGRGYDCRSFRTVGTVGNHWPGGMAEYILMPQRNIFPMAADVSLQEAAVCEPVSIAMNGMRETDIQGKTVLVIGVGPIGLGGVAAAKVRGAGRIIAAGRKPRKLELARAMGATDIIDLRQGDIAQQLLALNNGQKADFVLEASGCTDFVERCLDLTDIMCTMALVGFYDRPLRELALDDFVFGKITLRGCSGSREYGQMVARLLNEKKLNLRPLITHEIDFNDIEHAMDVYAQVAPEREKMLVRIAGEDALPST